VKLARFRKPNTACFFSNVEYRPNKNTSNITYIHMYIQNMHSKVRLVEDTKGGVKEIRKNSE
jgi:hypothetical protein